MIDRETQQRIKDAANIVEVVGDYVRLTRRGANYMGLCPFHNERTPSFSVSPKKNFCHCFSCKKGGSPVNFLMEKEGISYTEALLLLAKKYNIPVRERELTDEERRRMSEREEMLVANEWAMNYFHDTLYNTEEGRNVGLAYLYHRGITDAAIKKYKLGYSLESGRDLIEKARKSGFELEVFNKIGITGVSAQGKQYEKFRGRVIFPIRNTSGKPVAFGGRALRGEAAKYINTAETPIYIKSNELYGIYEAKPEMIRLDRVFLMEGYLDVISSAQAGLQNVVASSGTALTESQVSLIHRFTENVTLIYDGDAAGIKASLRGIDMLLSQGLHVKMLLLPDGEDPDSFAKKHTPEEFLNYIETHQTDFIRYKIQALLQSAGNNPQAISEAVRSVVTSIAHIPDEIERITYIKECAELTKIDESVIARQVGIAQRQTPDARNVYTQRPPREIGQQVAGERSAAEELAPADGAKDGGKEKVPELYIKQERELLKYCIKYGYLQMTFDEEQISVINFVDEEFKADEIRFTSPVHERVFDLIKENQAAFNEELEHYRKSAEEKLAAEREAFRNRLMEEGGSMAKIRSEEKKFARREEARRAEMLKEFAIEYSVGYLLNHEDDAVRQLATELVAERHTLSVIFTRNAERPIAEEDKLEELVPRALSELRAEIVNRQVQELQKKVIEAVEANDVEAQKELMEQLTKLHHFRSKLAENLGDRIIAPR